jgi:hypothetical protein
MFMYFLFSCKPLLGLLSLQHIGSGLWEGSLLWVIHGSGQQKDQLHAHIQQ